MRQKINVGISISSPFVIKDRQRYTGFEIELWEIIAKEVDVDFEYKEFIFRDLLSNISNNQIDIGFASASINEQREELYDFSYPSFNSGLRILLSKNRKDIDFSSTIKMFFIESYKKFLKPFITLLGITLLLGSILFFIEKNNGSFSPTYFPGAFQGTWVFLCSMLGLDGALFVYSVSSWTGRLIVSLGQIVSIAFLGLFIGELTAFITTKKIQLNIDNPKDLKNKTVATVHGSTSESALKSFGAIIKPTTTIEDSYKKLKSNEVDAVVFDSPVLVYYSLNDGIEWSEIVGDVFEKQDYGFILPEGSSLRKDINLALLTVKENGIYDDLYKKWFGDV